MLHKAWNSKGKMPYCFPRSSVKFQGHTVQNITNFDPNWAFPDYRPVAAFKSLRFALLFFVLDRERSQQFISSENGFSGRQNRRPIVPDEWHNHTGREAVTVHKSDGRVAIIEQNTKRSNFLKLRIFHTPDTISESWKLLWREYVISHM